MTVDRDARKKIYAQVQQLAADDLPYVSLWWVDNVAVMNRRLAGFEPYPNGSFRSLATLTLISPDGAGRPITKSHTTAKSLTLGDTPTLRYELIRR